MQNYFLIYGLIISYFNTSYGTIEKIQAHGDRESNLKNGVQSSVGAIPYDLYHIQFGVGVVVLYKQKKMVFGGFKR